MSPSGIRILAYEETPLGVLCLRQRETPGLPGVLITEVTLNHEFLMSSLHTDSERALASRALERRKGADLDVLIGGLGLGYTAREALGSDRVGRVEVFELLPAVIAWTENGLVPLGGVPGRDPRLVVREGDVYAMLMAPPASTRDVILIDVDHGPDAPLAVRNLPFYTRRGLSEAKRHLRPGGVLGVWSSDRNEDFEGSLGDVFAHVDVEPVEFRNELVDEDETNWIFLASD
jgi:spermidine synthase